MTRSLALEQNPNRYNRRTGGAKGKGGARCARLQKREKRE